MDSSVSQKDEIWFLRVCHRISNAIYKGSSCTVVYVALMGTVLYWFWKIVCASPSNLMYDSSFQKHGPRMKCSACKIIAHTSCISILMDRVKFSCKATFRDVGVRQYREQTCIHHHWVHRRSQKGKCKQCGKVGSMPCWRT